MNKKRLLPCILSAMLAFNVSLGGCTLANAEVEDSADICRHPEAFEYANHYTKHFSDKNEDGICDAKHSDFSKEYLSSSSKELIYSTDFDSKTKWPENLPEEFDIQRLMDIGKNPGLGVRDLHKQNITGKGVNIAILDQTLLVDHEEYKDNIKYYKEYGNASYMPAQMHGCALSSIAVGKDIGVAPDANLYYIADDFGWHDNGKPDMDILAEDVYRILDLNKTLPENQKIRAISVSQSLGKKTKGYESIIKAVKKASDEGVFVITTSMDETHNFNLMGLSKDPFADPDDFSVYRPGMFFAEYYYKSYDKKKNFYNDTLYLPMDYRCTASPTGTNDYVRYCSGGLSWTCPYLLGLYALACQVKADVTPNEFWKVAEETGVTNNITYQNKNYKFGKIINPQKLIDTLQNK